MPGAVLYTKKLVKFRLSTEKVGNQNPVIAQWADSEPTQDGN